MYLWSPETIAIPGVFIQVVPFQQEALKLPVQQIV